MDRLLLYLTGKNFNTRNRLEEGEVPLFSLLEVCRLLEAFFGEPCCLERVSFRTWVAGVPRIDERLLAFLQRAVSVHYTGTADAIFEVATTTFDDAIEALAVWLGTCATLPERVHGRTFAIDRVFHDIPLDTNGDLLVKRHVGRALASRYGLNVNLMAPEVKVSVIVSRANDAAGRLVLAVSLRGIHNENKGFDARLAKNRPVFEIGTMNPPLTSVLVNVAHPPWQPGAGLVDMFCGTGGILIEGLARGMQVIGLDVDTRAIKGCLKNVRHYSKRRAGFHLIKASALASPMRTASTRGFVTVTDPPYGKLESLRMLDFSNYIEAMLDISRDHDMIAFAVPATLETMTVALVQREYKSQQHHIDVQPWVEHASFTRSCIVIRRGAGPS